MSAKPAADVDAGVMEILDENSRLQARIAELEAMYEGCHIASRANLMEAAERVKQAESRATELEVALREVRKHTRAGLRSHVIGLIDAALASEPKA